jgi:hypothetical protein
LGFRQVQAWGFIRQREEAGLSRTLNEISEALGLDGKGHAWNVVHRLSERGLTYRDENGELRTSDGTT